MLTIITRISAKAKTKDHILPFYLQVFGFLSRSVRAEPRGCSLLHVHITDVSRAPGAEAGIHAEAQKQLCHNLFKSLAFQLPVLVLVNRISSRVCYNY